MSIVTRARNWASTMRARSRSLQADLFPDRRQDLAVLAIMKNESLNVDEWIEHYIWQGADHIFIIDNGSTDDTREKILASRHGPKLTLVTYPRKHAQSDHYRRVFRTQKIRSRFRWLLAVDADEFCFPKQHGTLPEALRALDWFDVIYVQWTYFGCRDQINHPKSLREGLLYRQPALGSHWNTKWFAKTDVLRGQALSIHKVRGANSAKTITANDYFQLNHYQTQSLEFWTQVKMTRGDAALSTFEAGRNLALFEKFNQDADQVETTLADKVKTHAAAMADALRLSIPTG
ncbi:MAG: hypothetical protein B7X55_06235 [Rhodobacterales bacterium 34-62-10]|nr:MAG: hypothetical protein B7X55_06235 [Rhodobacterales bacterium 34-62-10]